MAAPPQMPRPLSWPLSWMGSWHRAFVFQRRTRVLAEMLAAQIPPSASVLDIGCGDGAIGRLIAQIRPDIAIQGVEFLVRPECKIECTAFDGSSLPFPSDTFDVCLFVDVLHHTQDPAILLHEAGSQDLACGGARDRKSTRLNSSHQIISYAVFCLKKKKKVSYHRGTTGKT